MPAEVPPSRWPAGIVVGIGGDGPSSRAAVRLGAEEAALRRVPLLLVHGSRPAGPGDTASPPGMHARQQRGRRLVNGAARELAGTPLGRGLQISTESSPRTGIDLLLAHSRTAVMLVVQRRDGFDLPAGATTTAVTAAAECPTLVTRSDGRSDHGAAVLLLLVPGLDAAPATALASIEAALRRVRVVVLDGCGDGVAAQAAVREASEDAALMVVARPIAAEDARLVDAARCPVLVVAPIRARPARSAGSASSTASGAADGAPRPSGTGRSS